MHAIYLPSRDSGDAGSHFRMDIHALDGCGHVLRGRRRQRGIELESGRAKRRLGAGVGVLI